MNRARETGFAKEDFLTISQIVQKLQVGISEIKFIESYTCDFYITLAELLISWMDQFWPYDVPAHLLVLPAVLTFPII